MRHSGATGAVVLASREKLDAAAPYVVVPPAELGMRVVEAGLPGELTSPHHRLGLAGVIACPPVSWVPEIGASVQP